MTMDRASKHDAKYSFRALLASLAISRRLPCCVPARQASAYSSGGQTAL
jgi:hypothetical protein